MAQIRADEITALLSQKIANYEQRVQVDEVGTIMSLGDESRASTALIKSWPAN